MTVARRHHIAALLLPLGCNAAEPEPERPVATATKSTRDRPEEPAPNPKTGDAALRPAREPKPALLPEKVEDERIAEHLRFVAKPRPPGSPHAEAVRDRCAEHLGQLGYEVEIDAFDVEGIAGTNVVGRRRGRGPLADRVVAVGAHFDHIEGCAGADDNASGTAALFEVARVLALAEHERSLLVACWDREEDGLVGSGAFVADHDTKMFDVYFNFDAVGVRDQRPGSQKIPHGFELVFPSAVADITAHENKGDFLAVFSDSEAAGFTDAVTRHADAAGLRHVHGQLPRAILMTPPLGDLRRSDHARFWSVGIPAVFFTDTAPFRTDTYHCLGAPDEVAVVDLPFVGAITRTAVGAIEEALARP